MSNQSQGARQKRILITLAICVAAILLATIMGSYIQTAGWRYTVEDLRNAKNSGTISLVATDSGATEAKNYTVSGEVVVGTLFRPIKAEEGSRPAVVFSHGLFNNREMQIQNAIEAVRRGYVVIMTDQPGHGHNLTASDSFSGWNGKNHLSAAKYLYNLPEVDKERIAVSGHSMGGGSTTTVHSLDGRFEGTQTDANLKAGNNMGIVSAYLIQANVPPANAEDPSKAVAPNVKGMAVFKALADEFFFPSTLKTEQYVRQDGFKVTEENYADYYVKKGGEYVKAEKYVKGKAYYALTTSANTYWYLQSSQAFTFTRDRAPIDTDTTWETVNGGIYANGQLIAQPQKGKLVSVARKGEALYNASTSLRAVYSAPETHPMNHCSTTTAANIIDFFYNTFGVTEGWAYKAPTNQTWWLKEVFSAIGILGLFGMLLPILDLLLGTKAFASLKGEPAEAPVLLPRPRKHVSYWLGGLLSTIFGAVSFNNLVDGGNWYSQLGLDKILDNGANGFIYFNMGKMAAWGIMCTIFSVIVTGLIWLVNHIINVVKYGDEASAHDEHPFDSLKIRSAGNVFKTLVLVVILVAIFYGTVDFIWKTTCVQHQVWVFGPRVFVATKLASMVKYIPFFAIYYVAMSALAQGYRVKDLPEWATIAINVVFNVAGFMILIWYSNSYFINNGIMPHNITGNGFGNPMHFIHGFPMIPSIAIATVLARRIYVRTGNAWLAGLLNAVLMTIIGCANTSLQGTVAWTYGA